MYSLIIVDDEERIRSGLKNLIDWRDMGFDMVGDFPDGKQALEFLTENLVDVILTDIKMTYISGLELAEEVQKRNLDTVIVLLSGYQEFEFARKAINYNVKNYLLKPLKLDELYRVFTQIKGELDKKNEIVQASGTQYNDMDTLVTLFQEQFLRDLINGALYNQDKIYGIAKNLKVTFSDEGYVLMVVDVINSVDWEYDNDSIYNAIGNAFRMFIADAEVLTINYLMNRFIVLVEQADREAAVKAFMDSVLSKVVSFIDKELKLGVRIGVSNVHSGYDRMVQAYKEARIAVEGIEGGERIQAIFAAYCDLPLPSKKSVTAIIDYSENIYRYICEDNSLAVGNVIVNTVSEIYDLFESKKRRKNLIVQVVSSLYSKVMFNLPNDTPIQMVDYGKILSIDDKTEVTDYLKSIFVPITKSMAQNRIKTEQMIFEKAIDFILKNYTREDMCLNLVAEFVYLSPSYFSRSFKNYIGENFSDYLTKLRMEKAKQLLMKENLNVYEVSNRIGYKSSKYFSRLFKQITGVTPNEFRYGQQIIGTEGGELDD